MLAVMTAVTNLYSARHHLPRARTGCSTWLGTSLYLFGRIQFTMGMILAAILFAVMWFILGKTGWGRHVYAVGNEPEAARLTGIHIDKHAGQRLRRRRPDLRLRRLDGPRPHPDR